MESWKREFYVTDEGKNYLKHGRTYGSKNGVSTTPGYKAVGELAQGKKPGIGKTITNTAKANVLKGTSSMLNNSREQMFEREKGNGLSAEAAEKAVKINAAVDKADAMVNDLEKEIGSEKVSAIKNILSTIKDVASSVSDANTKKKDNAYDARKSIYEKELSRLDMKRKALQDEYTRANLLRKRKIQKELDALTGEIISVQNELGSLNLAYKDGRLKSDGRIVK